MTYVHPVYLLSRFVIGERRVLVTMCWPVLCEQPFTLFAARAPTSWRKKSQCYVFESVSAINDTGRCTGRFRCRVTWRRVLVHGAPKIRARVFAIKIAMLADSCFGRYDNSWYQDAPLLIAMMGWYMVLVTDALYSSTSGYHSHTSRETNDTHSDKVNTESRM
jgi:hypothetical protein